MNENKELPITEVKSGYIIGDKISHRITLTRGILTLMVVNIHSINLVVHFETWNVSWGNSPWLATIEYLFSGVVSRAAVPAFFFISVLISEYSFGMYLFHQLTLNCINKVYAKLITPSNISQLFGYFVIPSIVIAACVLFTIFLKNTH